MVIKVGVLHGVITVHEPYDEHRIAMALGYNFYLKEDLKLNYRFSQSLAIAERREKDSNTIKNMYNALRKHFSDFKTRLFMTIIQRGLLVCLNSFFIL